MHTPSRALAACSWSFQTSDADQLIRHTRDAGLSALQLHLDPFAHLEDPSTLLDRFHRADIALISGMMTPIGEDYTTIDSIQRTGGLRPTKHWPANRDAAERNADLAAALGLDLVTLHAGFIPESPDDPERAIFLDRLTTVADIFTDRNIRLGLETGQESAETLDAVLTELNHPSIGVNFDPANMLLYNAGDPTDALEQLGPRVLQVHFKDAHPSGNPDTWGTEVPLGEGSVDWPCFFDLLERKCPSVAAVIEREAGENRVADIRHAADFARRYIAVDEPDKI
ncbi:MAG: sugar phosphate isomerase/epimerase family protein [Planctomycetota bacterium]